MSESVVYQDPRKSVEERVNDLLQRMTLEEKVGQMCQMDGRHDPEMWVQEKFVGSLLHVTGEVTQKLQKLAEQTRLGIPLIFGIDAIHGHAFHPTGTVFPTQLAIACSWNPDLLKEVGRITAKEVTYTGIHWTFSPVLGTARDLRWGRIDETFGEDPYLIGTLGSALIQGYQGELTDPETIVACAKHYAGYPGTVGGRDSSEAELTRRSLRSLYLKPFHDAVKAGCASFMAGYQAIDGVPCSASKWLLTEVLKEEWGFEGFLVTDWNNLGWMHTLQKVCATMDEAVQRGIEAGNDMMMSTPEFIDTAIKLAQEGMVQETLIDDACRRILRLKFQLGLFDHNRYTNLAKGIEVIGCAEHRQTALESAYQSIVLLKNEENLLPLNDVLKRLAVIGPNADNMLAQLGDWTSLEWMEAAMMRREINPDATLREGVVTVLQGLQNCLQPDCEIMYSPGCDLFDSASDELDNAVEAARSAEVAIVVVGDTLTQNGERRDRANLDLSGGQQQLLEAIHATGTPMIVVLINGKPLSIPWIKKHVHAIVEAWNPGFEGGNAIAGILFGDRNPSAKLTISFPYHVGQQPVYYNQIPGWHAEDYVDMPVEPLFAFGYGLSYTTYDYSNLRLQSEILQEGQVLQVEVDVKNTGQRAGTEIVQLYINDIYSSVTTPVKELKAFQRVDLQPGERETVLFEIPYNELALVNQDLESVVEPGEFEVMVGSSSRDQDLLKAVFEVRI